MAVVQGATAVVLRTTAIVLRTTAIVLRTTAVVLGGELGNPVVNGHNSSTLLISVNSWTGYPVGDKPKISGGRNKTNWVTLFVMGLIPMEFKIKARMDFNRRYNTLISLHSWRLFYM